MKVLIINVGWEQGAYVQTLIERGCELYCVSSIPLEPGAHQFFNGVLITDYSNLAGIIAFAHSIGAEAVLSDQCDFSYFAQAVISQYLGLPGPKLSTAQVCTNKLLQRELLAAFEINQPKFARALCLEDINGFVEKNGLPIVIKPVDSRGSFGVSIVRTKQDLNSAFYAALQESSSKSVIIEEYIQGVEFTVDGYAFNGEPKLTAVGKKSKFPHMQHVANGIDYGVVNIELENRLKKYCADIAKILGISFGFIHAECMVNAEGRIFLVEMANRGGGCLTSTILNSLITGLNMVDIYCNDCLGSNAATVKQPFEKYNYASLKFFSVKHEGIINDITGWDNSLTTPGVFTGRLNISVGDTLSMVRDDASRHGFMILCGNTNNQDSVFRNATSKLKVT